MGVPVAKQAWGAALVLAALLLACDESYEGANGSPCLKNQDCASDHCVATVCQPKPVFNGQASGGAGGDSGSAGAAGE